MAGRLTGKRALVTGAGRGIGAGIARRFAEEGASVVLHFGRSGEGARALHDEIVAAGGRAAVVGADLASVDQVGRLARAALAAFDGLDVLVNNAALFNEQHVFDTTLETFERLHAVNLRAPFLLCQAIGKAMWEQGHGAIVNVASGGGLAARPGFETGVAYVASKAGLVLLSRRLAIDLAPRVRVNVLVPGIVDSKPVRWNQEQRARYAARNLFNRPQGVEDVVPGAVFLASDEAAFMTGEVLVLDGGAMIANQMDERPPLIDPRNR